MKPIQSLSQELSRSGGKLVAMKCDVRKEEDILSMMSANKSQFGGASRNNAGLSHPAPLLTGATEKRRDIMEVIYYCHGSIYGRVDHNHCVCEFSPNIRVLVSLLLFI